MKNKRIGKIVKSIIAAFLLINLGLTAYGFYMEGVPAFADDDDFGLGASAPGSTDTSGGGGDVYPDKPGSTLGGDNKAPPKTAPAPSFHKPIDDLQKIGEDTGLPSFYFEGGQHSEAPVDYEYKGVGTIGSTAYFLMDLFKYLMSGVAIIMIVIISIKLITGGSNEETATKSKKGLGIAIAGLIVIQLADIMVKKVFFGEHGEVLEDKSSAELFAREGAEEIRGIVGFVQIALGAISVLVIIINGIRIMISGGEEEARKKGLKNIGYAAGGLILVLMSELIIRGFIMPEYGEKLPSIEVGKRIFAMATNFISGFVALIAFVMLVYAGYTYVVAGSDESSREKVKKMITGGVIGLILAMGAYAITNTLIKFEEPDEYQAPQENTIIENEDGTETQMFD